MTKVIIIGGGLAGLVNAILLARAGIEVTLFEKKKYPFHRVCGEYVSNEVVPFLKINDLYPDGIDIPAISKLILSSTNGKQAQMDLDLGGFGISRYTLDYFLMKHAKAAGVTILDDTKVDEVTFEQDRFRVRCKQEEFEAYWVIGAFGKRANLDKGRAFLKHKSPYLAVKYHIQTDFADDTIALHNFEGGYCGISKVDNDVFNLCYLAHRDHLRKHHSIAKMEQEVLAENPALKAIWKNSEFLFDKPLVINEISFAQKQPVENHILMSGDTAGTITPLCGNGMAMAIRSAEQLSSILIQSHNEGWTDRIKVENAYRQIWQKTFGFRLWSGRQVQRLFGAKWSSNLAVQLAKFHPIANQIVKLTHGEEF